MTEPDGYLVDVIDLLVHQGWSQPPPAGTSAMSPSDPGYSLSDALKIAGVSYAEIEQLAHQIRADAKQNDVVSAQVFDAVNDLNDPKVWSRVIIGVWESQPGRTHDEVMNVLRRTVSAHPAAKGH